MNFLVVVASFFLGGITVIALGIAKVESFFDGIREAFSMLLG